MNAVRRIVSDKSDIARSLQNRCRGWLVIWSKWRQTYTAFSCMTTEPMIIDDADFDRFLDRIEQVERKRVGELPGAVNG